MIIQKTYIPFSIIDTVPHSITAAWVFLMSVVKRCHQKKKRQIITTSDYYWNSEHFVYLLLLEYEG